MTTSWSHPDQLTLIKGMLLTTLPILGKEFKISFDFTPYQYLNGWTCLVHLTSTGTGYGTYGARIPSLHFRNDLGLHICSAISGKHNKCYNTGMSPVLNKWTEIIISQTFEEYKYIFRWAFIVYIFYVVWI